MKICIDSIDALEILDSRGNPTVRVNVHLDNGIIGTASVPSGVAAGENEAVEPRDGEKNRYGGKGVRKAIKNIDEVLVPGLKGTDPRRQAEIDYRMIELDGTENKAKLGANAMLGISQAVARAAAQACGLPLYAYLGGVGAVRLPIPMMNQIGTVAETIEAIHLCRKVGWGFVISHRSGETEDAFMADFAVAMGGGQIKTGSACRSERIAKYNRLLEIERELGKAARFGR